MIFVEMVKGPIIALILAIVAMAMFR